MGRRQAGKTQTCQVLKFPSVTDAKFLCWFRGCQNLKILRLPAGYGLSGTLASHKINRKVYEEEEMQYTAKEGLAARRPRSQVTPQLPTVKGGF